MFQFDIEVTITTPRGSLMSRTRMSDEALRDFLDGFRLCINPDEVELGDDASLVVLVDGVRILGASVSDIFAAMQTLAAARGPDHVPLQLADLLDAWWPLWHARPRGLAS